MTGRVLVDVWGLVDVWVGMDTVWVLIGRFVVWVRWVGRVDRCLCKGGGCLVWILRHLGGVGKVCIRSSKKLKKTNHRF